MLHGWGRLCPTGAVLSFCSSETGRPVYAFVPWMRRENKEGPHGRMREIFMMGGVGAIIIRVPPAFGHVSGGSMLSRGES